MIVTAREGRLSRLHLNEWPTKLAIRTEIHYVIRETFLSVYRSVGRRYLLQPGGCSTKSLIVITYREWVRN
jgi:hypothetical protein